MGGKLLGSGQYARRHGGGSCRGTCLRRAKYERTKQFKLGKIQQTDSHNRPHGKHRRAYNACGRSLSYRKISRRHARPFGHGKGLLSVGIIWFVSSIAEFLIYTPMLGSGGGYLAFITGNLINMKIPCAVNARDMVGAKTGTKENEIISTLSIATSSLVTILVLAVGVAILTR